MGGKYMYIYICVYNFFSGLEGYHGITQTNPSGWAEFVLKIPNNDSKWRSNLEPCVCNCMGVKCA